MGVDPEPVVQGRLLERSLGHGVGADVEEGVEMVLVEADPPRCGGSLVQGDRARQISGLGQRVQGDLEIGFGGLVLPALLLGFEVG